MLIIQVLKSLLSTENILMLTIPTICSGGSSMLVTIAISKLNAVSTLGSEHTIQVDMEKVG